MRKIPLQLVVLLLPALLLSSCATIVSKSSYPVSIRTDPKGANITIIDKKGTEVYKGRSPALVKLKSGAGFFTKASYQVKISAPGFDEQIVPVNYRLDGWYFGNILIGGLLGLLVIDPATGAMWMLDTEPIDVYLVKSNDAANAPSLQIIDVKDLPTEQKKNLVRIK